MRYIALLHGDESRGAAPGTPEFEAEMIAYGHFDEVAGQAIVAGEALEPTARATTVRSADGTPLVIDGPFAEGREVIGGIFVLEADTLDDGIELARHIPAAADGAVELRPMVEWFDRGPAGEPAGEPGGDRERYVAFIWGKETDADVPDTPAWQAGAAEHGRFVEAADGAVRAGGALHPAATATTVRVRDGEVLVTDGPFAETAEVIGGLYLFAPVTRDHAASLAARVPVNPGGAVELRPVMEVGG